MLDSDTKRRIDTARDILVGKVPDPKSQVEQITIALIYKFMDDMDAESEELGGKRKFFTGDYAQYGWARLMAPSLGGHAMLGLYGEGIAKMPENPGIPPLFRDIFKNAYLPYRDPETLKAFLKQIDGFSYDHSERLGDAFEYLLSVLGSQGDAGQFRTPRHIIDFMVEVLAPQKSETILDPACGTAGFLISAYKHILRANTDPKGHSRLTPDERGRLAKNFKGYDISPDMVRLSLVNLYLHGFTSPHIHEYDTLTSQDRWTELADVILANPPFMSPKGGIKPHQRFSIQAKRSEVLFVDYMAEHLTPTGRAAIIVPEGIIFQSQTAYKDLRRLLVENSLVAVVSLPAGCFNPYSGVKTSILILDKSLAKHARSIAFFKVENDGFGLGAQRRAIDKNDLPHVQAGLTAYLQALRTGTSPESLPELTATAQLVPKEKIAANGDYNLSGERYREGGQRTSLFPHVELGDVVDILDSLRRPITKSDRKPGPYPYYGATGVLDHVEGFLFDEPLVLVGEDGAKWGAGENSAFPVEGKVWVNNHAHVLRPKRDLLMDRFLIEILNEADLLSYVTGVTVPKLNQEKLRSIQIPLPPLEVQKEIVAEIEGYQKVINGARAVLDHYRPHIPIHPDWPMVAVGDIVEFVSGLTVSIPEVEAEGGTPILAINNVTEEGKLTLVGIRFIKPPSKTLNFIEKGDLLFNWRNGSKHLVGKTARFDLDGRYLFASFLLGIRPHKDQVDSSYLWHTLNIYRREGRYIQFMRESVNGLFNREELKMVEIPLPPLATQQAIVAEIEAEQALVAANRELITRFEQKIQATLARIWGEPGDEPAPAIPQPSSRTVSPRPPGIAAPAPAAAAEAEEEAPPPIEEAPPAPEPTPRAAPATRPTAAPAALESPSASVSVPTHPEDLEKNDLMSLLREVLTTHGPCDRETAIRQAAATLGFQRVSAKSYDLLDSALRTAVKRKVLFNESGELRVNRQPLADLDRDFLKDQFMSALADHGRGWVERPHAIRAFARWFGYRRTGPLIEETARTLINALLRDNRLEKDGPAWIRRA